MEVDRIFSLVDTDRSGFIDFNEFVMATVARDKLLTDEKLKAAFQLFDRDRSGAIDANEIKHHIGVGKKVDEEVWNAVLAEVDLNGNGTVEFNEFAHMMSSPRTAEQRRRVSEGR